MNLRQIKNEDIPIIGKLFKEHSNRKLSIEILSDLILKFPSCLVLDENRIIGFAYSKRFAPDVLELQNIFISPKYRNKGIGSQVLRFIEMDTISKFNAIILVNSMLYSRTEKKKFANTFYIKNGYKMIAKTSNTLIFFKEVINFGSKQNHNTEMLIIK